MPSVIWGNKIRRSRLAVATYREFKVSENCRGQQTDHTEPEEWPNKMLSFLRQLLLTHKLNCCVVSAIPEKA